MVFNKDWKKTPRSVRIYSMIASVVAIVFILAFATTLVPKMKGTFAGKAIYGDEGDTKEEFTLSVGDFVCTVTMGGPDEGFFVTTPDGDIHEFDQYGNEVESDIVRDTDEDEDGGTIGPGDLLVRDTDEDEDEDTGAIGPGDLLVR